MATEDYELDLVPEKYKKFVELVLGYEDVLSDGYKYYCGFSHLTKDYDNDIVLETLIGMAKSFYGDK